MDLLAYWHGFYNDPWFWQFPMATLAISMMSFLTVAIPWTVIAWFDPVSLRKYKIQQKPFEFEKFFWPSIARIIINNLILIAVLVITWPLLKLTGVHNTELPVWYIIIAQLLFLEAESSEKDIYLYINSPGGIITSGMGIYDTMNYIKPDVATICMGQAASMGAFLLAGGKKGKRSALPNARIMIHQPLGGAEGQASDIKIQADEILRLKNTLNKILAKNTKQTLKKIENDTDRNFFMSTKEAKDYGIIDTILSGRK